MRVVARAASGLLAIAAVAFALVSTLPAPAATDRVAVSVLAELDHSSGTGSTMRLGDLRLRATCRRLSKYRYLVTIDDGSRLVLSGTHVSQLPPSHGRTLASVDPELLSAQVDLAGSYSLYARQIAGRLARGLPVVTGTAIAAGRPAYELRLGRDRPRVSLLVDRATLRPLVATYRSATLTGRSLLARPAHRRAAC